MVKPLPIADAVAEADALIGSAVGRYEVRESIGKGSQGEVYLGFDGKLKRNVAIKRLAPALRADPTFRKRFLREAEQTSRFSDGHIAAIYDLIEQGDDIFLVMEFIDGETLRRRMERPLPLAEFLSIASQCAEGLSAAEQHSIVHCDIKPENIMLTRSGQVKILDFGVAKRLPRADSESTQDLSKLSGGTPAYMAPEVLQEGEATSASDVFSLGVVFYEALTGTHPFRASNFFKTSHNILQVTPPAISAHNPQVPSALVTVVDRMLAKDSQQRYHGAQDLLRDLHSLQLASMDGLRPLPAQIAFTQEEATGLQASRRISSFWKLGAVAALLVAGVAAWRFWPTHAQPVMHLAILPLSPCADDGGSRAFCDGITATLNAKVTQIGNAEKLDVVPASEIVSSKVATLEQAQSQFGVSHVLQGSLQRSGNTVRINWSLVDANTRTQIRSGTITESSSDTFAVQDQVVASVLKLLDLSQPAPASAQISYGTNQPQAYEFYLRGIGFLNQFDNPDKATNAALAFNSALDSDPNFALAYAGLGRAFWLQFQQRQDSVMAGKALDACKRAVALGPQFSSGLVCLATVYNGTGKSKEAIEMLRRALEIEPANSDALTQLALAYTRTGDLKDAEASYLRTIEMHPQDPLAHAWLGGFYYKQARYEDAAREYNRVNELDRRNTSAYNSLAGIRIQQGLYEAAIEAANHSIAIRPSPNAFSNLGVAYFYQGKFAEAAQAYQKASAISPKFQYPGNIGEALYWIPDRRAESIPFLQSALEHSQALMRVNASDPDPISAAATYQAFLGHTAAALDLVRRTRALPSDKWDPEYSVRLAKASALSGDPKQALELLKVAIQQGYPMSSVRNDPAISVLAPQLQSNIASAPR